MIRQNKTTPNADAARVLILGAICAIIIIVALDPAVAIWQRYMVTRPWVMATVEIVPARDGRPDILYGAQGRFPVAGTWTAWIESAGGNRECTGSGPGTYRPGDKAPELWDWTDWLGRDCAEPDEPYRACVSYRVQSERGNWDTTDPTCSALYDPRSRKVLK